MNFFKNFLASFLGSITALFFVISLGFFLLAGIASVATFDKNVIQGGISSNSILNLDLDKDVYDNIPVTQEFEEILGVSPEIIKFLDLINAIELASDNENIKGINLKSQSPKMGWSQTLTIRKALQKFKDKGKFIYCYGDFFSQKGYYLASVSDSIFLNPMGNIELRGLGAEVLYYKDLQEKYGFKMEVVRHGKYKSAVEPYLDNKMSDANRNQIKSLLNSIWDGIGSQIKFSRKISSVDFNKIVDDLDATFPENAHGNNIIDGILSKTQYEHKLKKVLGIESDEKLNNVSYVQMKNSYNSKKGTRNQIAVIYAQGPIIYGEGNERNIGQEIFSKTIRKIKKSKRIKAVVLRIDSPGGVALTSEIIWNELIELKKEKPIVVSMGNVAASGGYYLSTVADKVFANDFTITGSIGVFAMVPNIAEFSKGIGINAEQVETNKNSIFYTPFEKPTQKFQLDVKKNIENIYEMFKKRVSDGRNISMDEVEGLAQGRVWSGEQALKNGLANEEGDIKDAINAAAELADLGNDFNITSYPKIEPEINDILSVMIPFNSSISEFLNATTDLDLVIQSISNKEKKPIIFTSQLFNLDIR
ncbi:signal peptide peptidase SppA [Bacteroidota bacterium]|nr:signal peptide peptidase SppA [Bacteroidota bacterium]